MFLFHVFMTVTIFWKLTFCRILQGFFSGTDSLSVATQMPKVLFFNYKDKVTAWRWGTGDLFHLADLNIFPISWSLMVGWNQLKYLLPITCRIQTSHTLNCSLQTFHTFFLIWCTFHFTSLYIDYSLSQEFNLRFYQPVPITMKGMSLLSLVSLWRDSFQSLWLHLWHPSPNV